MINKSKQIFIIHTIFGVPLSSTQTPSVQHIGSIRRPNFFSTQNPSGQYHKPVSSTPKSLSFIPKTPQFNKKPPSVKHQKPLSSTPKPTHLNSSWGVLSLDQRGVLNWSVSGVELRGGSEGLMVWNREVFGVELRHLGAEKEWPFCVELMCWTEELWNWGGPNFLCYIKLPSFEW